jgi:hypothetical protein
VNPHIQFKTFPFSKDNDQRGFVVHEIAAFLNDEKVGYIKLSYVEKSRFDQNIRNNVFRFRSIWSGHCDVPDELFDADISKLNEYFANRWSFLGRNHAQYEYEKHKREMQWASHYYINKPIVDFIRSERLPRHGIATMLHIYAICWLREYFNLKLHMSTCICDHGKLFYFSDKTKKALPLRTVPKIKGDHYLNVARQYFLMTRDHVEQYKKMKLQNFS